jgi:deoxycytidine triphosphate deaminase
MLLNDEQLVELDENIIKGLSRSGDLYTAKSLIQPASVDLTIGDIFLPEKKEGEKGSIEWPFESYSLPSGETAIVQTKEELNLPDDLAAIGFPPSRVTSKGLLMTNPGHVDPGYKGRMRVIVINMGRESYHLQVGEMIVTLLFFRLQSAAKKSFSQRNPYIQSTVSGEELSKLGADFLEIERRAEGQAKKYLAIGATISVGVPIIVASIMVFGNINAAKEAAEKRMNEIEHKIVQNKASLDMEVNNLKSTSNYHNLEKKIEALETSIKKGEPRSPKP